MAKTYIGVADRYFTKLEKSGIVSTMKSTETYYFGTEVSDNGDRCEHKTLLTYYVNHTTPAVGTNAIGLYVIDLGGRTESVGVYSSEYYKVTGISDDGYLICDKYNSSLTEIAHRVTKKYIGVDNVARKVKKAYLGVNGVAQLVYIDSNIHYVFAFDTSFYNDDPGINYAIESLPKDGFDKTEHNYLFNKVIVDEFYPVCGCEFKGKIILGGNNGSFGNCAIAYINKHDDISVPNNWHLKSNITSGNYEVLGLATNGTVCVALLGTIGRYHKIYTSTDGINWTFRHEFTSNDTYSNYLWLSNVTFVNNKFYIITDDNILSSSDGSNWEFISIMNSDNTNITKPQIVDLIYDEKSKVYLVAARDQRSPFGFQVYRGENLDNLSVVFNSETASLPISEDGRRSYVGRLKRVGDFWWCGAHLYSSNGITWRFHYNDQGDTLILNNNSGEQVDICYINGQYYSFSVNRGDFQYNHSDAYFTVTNTPGSTKTQYLTSRFTRFLELTE